MFGNQFHGISGLNLPTPDHITIQREHAAKFPHNVGEYLTVLFQTIWVKRRHDATPTEILYPNDDVPDAQALPWPVPLGQPLDATDHEIRSESPAIISKSGDGTIRRNQQGQHVKTAS